MANRARIIDELLLDAARGLASALKKASCWPTSRKVFDLENDGLYELYCLLRAVRVLRMGAAYALTYYPGSGPTMHSFPRAPARKAGRPRFEIRDRKGGGLLWQLCYGTAIRDRHGHDRHPDISFQNGTASDEPTHNDIVMMWDAKYRTDRADRISEQDVATFYMWVDSLGLNARAVPNIDLAELEYLLGNTLVTNGNPSTEKDDLLRSRNMRECWNFYPGSDAEVRPA